MRGVERLEAGDVVTPGDAEAVLVLAEWLVERRVAITGCDTWSYGPVPPEDPAEPFVVPQTLNVKHGVVVLENLNLARPAGDGVAEFMLVSPTPTCAAPPGPGWPPWPSPRRGNARAL